MNINRLCPGCMRDLEEAWTARTQDTDGKESQKTMRNRGKCPHCGFDFATYRGNSRCLPIHTILAGKYLVGAVLGEGGFGITYMGYDLNMQTRIAIKEYFPVELVSRDTTSLTGDRVISLSGEKSATYQQGLQKYVIEAQNVSQFSETPGVVSVKDFFYENETAYIVMEYIDGISLKDYLKERGGRLSETEALAIMKPILEALVKVHEAGIIHRDISPDNIMLTFSGKGESGIDGLSIASVKLIDFGAARMTAKNDQKSLTIILKHGYAPEEQYRTHGEQGPWTDVYAVCAVLYRMLTGQTPVPAMDRLFQDDLKSFEDLSANVSKSTQAVILKGLAVKREDRIQSMEELFQVLYEGRLLEKAHISSAAIRCLIGAGAVLAAIIGIILLGVTVGKQDEMLSASTSVPGADTAAADMAGGADVAKNAGEESQARLPADEESNGNSDNRAREEEASVEFEAGREEFGEVIVTANPQTSIASGTNHAVIRNQDGTVTVVGSNEKGRAETTDWNRIAAVAAGDSFSAGLREDGKVVVAGELESLDEVKRWENIVAITANEMYLFGLTIDGTIVGNLNYYDSTDYYQWTDIKAIAVGSQSFNALTVGGEVLTILSGGRAGLGVSVSASGWEDVNYIACAQVSLAGITESGGVKYCVTEEEVSEDSYDFTGLESFQDIVQLHVGPLGQYGVTSNGEIVIGGTLKRYETVRQQFPALYESTAQWENMQGVTVFGFNETRIVGLTKDGFVLKAVENYGNSTPETMKDMAWIAEISQDCLMGTTKDGRVCTYGGYENMQGASGEEGVQEICDIYSHSRYYAYYTQNRQIKVDSIYGWTGDNKPETFCWNNVVQMVGGKNRTFLLGLFEDGTVRMRYDKTKDYVPREYEYLSEVESWSGIIQLAVSDYEMNPGSYYKSYENIIYGLNGDGSVISIRGDGKTDSITDGWTDISAIFSGKGSIGAIRKDGSIVFSNPDDNDYGQRNTFGWSDITQLSLGEYHTVGLKEDGTVMAVGSNLSGQCEVEDWKDIVFVTAGNNCTIGIRKDGTLEIVGEVCW